VYLKLNLPEVQKMTLGYYATVVKDGTTPAVEASLQVSTVRYAKTVYG